MSGFVIRRVAGLAFAFGCLAGIAGTAEANKAPVPEVQAFDCTRTGGSTNLMSQRLFIIRAQGTGEVAVMDEIIYTVNGKEPVMAKVSGDTAKRLDISWVVERIPLSNRGSTGRATYRATLFKDSLTYVESVVLSGYDNSESSSGSCKLMQ